MGGNAEVGRKEDLEAVVANEIQEKLPLDTCRLTAERKRTKGLVGRNVGPKMELVAMWVARWSWSHCRSRDGVVGREMELDVAM